MRVGPIVSAKPLENYILRVVFDNGNSVTVDFSPRLHTFRFCALKDPAIWLSADTDGVFTRWHRDSLDVVEVAYDEIMKMTLGETY